MHPPKSLVPILSVTAVAAMPQTSRAAFPVNALQRGNAATLPLLPASVAVTDTARDKKAEVATGRTRRRKTLRTLSLICGILFLACIGVAIATGVSAWLIGWPVFGIAAVALGADKENKKQSAGFILGVIAFAPIFAVFLLPRFIALGVNGFLNLFRKPGKKRVLSS